MTTGTGRDLHGFSSMGASIAAYQPYYAPPVAPQTNFIQTRSSQHMSVPAAQSGVTTGNMAVSHKNRIRGMRFLFSRGSKKIKQFRMRSTGQVEVSTFQPVTAWTWCGSFNDALFQAGYPRNLGLSEKVATIPPQALGTSTSQMLPRPQITRSIFTNRSFSTVKGLPAKGILPTQGAHS